MLDKAARMIDERCMDLVELCLMLGVAHRRIDLMLEY